MILLGALFLLAIIKIISRKFNAVKIICVFFTVWFLALNYAGADAMITKYNIAKSKNDNSAALDVSMFTMLSDSMVPAAIKELDNKNIVTRYDLKMLLTGRYNVMQDKNWQAMNVASNRTKKLLDENKANYYVPNNADKKTKPQTNKEMVFGYMPKLKGVESCEWYIGPVKDISFSGREDGYALYGYAVLSDQYFNEINASYDWTNDLIAFQYGIEYFNKLPEHNMLLESEVFTNELAGDNFLLTLLNKADKKLYFYLETN